MNTTLVTLVPPVAGGVRDYADILARRVASRIVAATPDTPPADYGEDDLLLNFSGYGYQPRGVPLWLVQRLRARRPRLRSLGVFFHELFAQEPPWRSAFWLGPAQRGIAADLAALSDYWLTSGGLAADWLRRHAPARPHQVLPVFSNVGEPALAAGARPPRIVVFGGPATRAATYRALGDSFWRWADAQGLAVHDIGPPMATPAHPAHSARLARGALVVHGVLPAPEVSRHLREARFGLLRYPTHVAGKSGVFAAYCAHGLCPVLLAPDYRAHDGLTAGRHYVAGQAALEAGGFDAGALAVAAHQWYLPHRVQAHADALQALRHEAVAARSATAC